MMRTLNNQERRVQNGWCHSDFEIANRIQAMIFQQQPARISLANIRPKANHDKRELASDRSKDSLMIHKYFYCAMTTPPTQCYDSSCPRKARRQTLLPSFRLLLVVFLLLAVATRCLLTNLQASCGNGFPSFGTLLVSAAPTGFITLSSRRNTGLTSSSRRSGSSVTPFGIRNFANLHLSGQLSSDFVGDKTASHGQQDDEPRHTRGKVENDDWIRNALEEQGIDPSTIMEVAHPEMQGKETSIPPTRQDRLEDQQVPFSKIVGNDLAKQALIMAAANPQGLGSGVLLFGGHGTGKSVLCRSMQRLLHQRQHPSTDVHTKSVPFVTVPLHCQEDDLLGSLDLERSMKEGDAVFEPGLLARAHHGILYVDDIHLLEEGLIHILLTAVSNGFVTIEREGVSIKYPCQPLLLASFNPTEGGGDELRQHWADRIAMTVPMTDSADMDPTERVHVVEQVEAFADKTMSAEEMAELEEEEMQLWNAIQSARMLLPQVKLSEEQLLYLCREASRADCEGQRAEIYASEIARTSAALDGRTQVTASDLQRAVLFAIAPRARALPDATQSEDSMDQDVDALPPQPQPPVTMEQQPPPPDTPPPELEETDDPMDNMEQEQEEEMEDMPEDEDENQEDDEELVIPDYFMFGVDNVAMDPQLLNFQQWTRQGKGGKRSKIFNLKRGRFIKALVPKDWKAGKIAVGATLRAAAPHQKIRRERAKNKKDLVYITNSDFRIKRLARKSGSLILFVVDASGSMALNRMGAAKGAAMSLLQEAYKSRDKVCLISFRGEHAEVLVPPTKSMALARRRLEAMPCGGKTPLAHALVLAIRTGTNAIKVKQDVSKVVVVLLADGRSNVPLCVSEGGTFDAALMDPDFDTANESKNLPAVPSRAFLKTEVLAIAKQLGTLDQFNLLCIDTEDRFVGTGMAKELTRQACGSYFHLTPSTATSEEVARIARQGVNHVREQQ